MCWSLLKLASAGLRGGRNRGDSLSRISLICLLRGAGFREVAERGVEAQHCGSGHRLHRERSGDPVLGPVPLRPVIQNGVLRRLVIGQRSGRHLRHLLVNKPAAHPLIGMSQGVVVEVGGHKPLPGQRQRHPRRVASNPPPPPLLGHISRSPASASRVENQIPWVRGHKNAALDHAISRLHHIAFVVWIHLTMPDIVNLAARHFFFVSLPSQRCRWVG